MKDEITRLMRDWINNLLLIAAAKRVIHGIYLNNMWDINTLIELGINWRYQLFFILIIY